jgi:hypothetical protein
LKFTKANQTSAWKKCRLKFEGVKALVNDVEQGVDMWNTTSGDLWPLEKNLEEIPMLLLFSEHGFSPPASNFFHRLLEF